MWIIDAYESGATFGTKEFKERVYTSHWQIVGRPVEVVIMKLRVSYYQGRFAVPWISNLQEQRR